MGRTHSLRTFVVALIAAVFVFAGAGQASAKAKKKKKPAPKADTTAQDKAFGALKGPYKWGQSPKQILKILKKQINERYAEKIQATNDVYTQDKLRRTLAKELKRVEKSYVKFDGKTTGWDVSIVDDQFAQKTDESMMVYWENHQGKDQRRFFFFHEEKLYKMFIALNTDNAKDQKNFAFYQTLLEKQFGTGEVGFRVDKEGVEWPSYIEWKTPKFVVQALDKLSFYGSFCLWIADPEMLREVETIRKENAPPPEKENQVIKAITSDDEDADEPGLNENKGKIDAIFKD